LKWSILSIPNLFQTTAFGLTGLVTIDMLSRLSVAESSPIELIFLDTLYHFSETLDLVSRVQAQYPNVKLHIYKPQDTETAADFEAKYGEKFWETDDDRYDFLAKVEPAQRAYAELGVRAVLTGRRKSQGGKRGSLDIIEVDDAGIIKINPLANWSFAQVKKYVDEHNVPYNVLLDQGYKSVGDWHSTQPVKEGEDERAGRWAGKEKSECGIHNSRSVYAQYLEEMDRKEQQAQLTAALMNNQYPYGEASEVEGLPVVAEDPVAEAIEETQPLVELSSPKQEVSTSEVEYTPAAPITQTSPPKAPETLALLPKSQEHESVSSPLEETHLQNLVTV
jgi:phosphoadenosine phosphosulfate reductase